MPAPPFVRRFSGTDLARSEHSEEMKNFLPTFLFAVTLLHVGALVADATFKCDGRRYYDGLGSDNCETDVDALNTASGTDFRCVS